MGAAEIRTLLRSPRLWLSTAAVVGTGHGAYLLLAFQHAELNGYTSAPGLVSPRFLIHVFGVAPLWVLLVAIALFAFDGVHRDQRSRISEALAARPLSNLGYVAGRFGAVLVTSSVVFLFTLATIQALGLLAQAFEYPVGDPIEPVSLLNFFVVDVLPGLACWCALLLLVAATVRNRIITLALAIALLACLHWLLYRVPTYLLAVVSPLPNFGTLASDLLPAYPDSSVLAQRILALMFASGLLLAAGATHPRPDGPRSSHLGAIVAALTLVLAAALGLAGLFFRATEAMALRDRWHVAQQAVDERPRANLVRIEGSVRLDPGRALRLDLDLTLSGPSSGTPLNDLVLSFNPGMEPRELLVDGDPRRFRHEDGLLLVDLPFALKPGSDVTLSLAATGVPDPRFAYLDEAVNADEESWSRSQLPFLGSVASVFETDYVALMPATRWLPLPGPNLTADQAHGYEDHFAIDLEVGVPAGWHVAGPGRGEPTGANRVRLRPSAQLAEVTLVAAPFERYATTVNDVEFEMLLHPKHTRNADFLADATGISDAVVRRLTAFLNDAADYGIPYPYRRLSVVEAPAQLRLYGGGWRLASVRSSPGVLLLREHGFPTARLNREVLNAQAGSLDAGRAQDLASDKLNGVLQQYFVQDRLGGNLLAGTVDNLLPFLVDVRGDSGDLAEYLLASLTSMQFGIRRPPFTAHALTDTGLSRTGAKAVPHGLAGRLASFAAGVAAPYNAGSGWDLEHPSLWQRATDSAWSDIAPGDDPHHALATKSLLGNLIALSIWYSLGRDGVARLLSTIRVRYEGGLLTMPEFTAAAREHGTHDVVGLAWANERPAPALRVSSVRVQRLARDDPGGARYQVTLQTRNEAPTPGMLRLVIGTDPGTDSPWLRRRTSAPVVVPGHSSVEVGMVSDAPPLDAWLASYFSQNRSDMRLRIQPEESLNLDTPALEGSRPTAWRPPKQVGIVVDDLDPGFTVQSTKPLRLQNFWIPRVGDRMPLDQGLPAYRQALGEGGHMPASGILRPDWSRQEVGAAWGRYRRTLVRTPADDGSERAVFSAVLPGAGRWHLAYHLPDLSSRPRRVGLQSWTIAGDWNGGRLGTHHLAVAAEDVETTVAFDADSAGPGWNRVGTYTLPPGEVSVTVSNRSTGETVIADAVRWTQATATRASSKGLHRTHATPALTRASDAQKL